MSRGPQGTRRRSAQACRAPESCSSAACSGCCCHLDGRGWSPPRACWPCVRGASLACCRSSRPCVAGCLCCCASRGGASAALAADAAEACRIPGAEAVHKSTVGHPPGPRLAGCGVPVSAQLYSYRPPESCRRLGVPAQLTCDWECGTSGLAAGKMQPRWSPNSAVGRAPVCLLSALT